ncbi:MAG: ABC transporter permease [Faecousia sp.]
MEKMIHYLHRKEKYMTALGILFVFVQVWLELKMPEYMSAITRLVKTPGSEMGEILRNGAYMLLSALGSMAAAIATGYLATRVAAALAQTLRGQLFRKVMGFYNEELERFSTASLITRSTNDVSQVQMLVAMGMQIITKTPVMMVWGLTKIVGKQWQRSLATFSAVAVISLLILAVAVLVLPKFKVIQRLTDDLNRVTRENLTGIRVIRAYHAEGYQQKKFEAVNAALTHMNLFADQITALLMPTMTLITSAISLAIYWVGAYLLAGAGGMERLTIFSDMVVFSQYAMQVIMAFAMMTVLFVMLPRVMVSVHRINEVLDTGIRIQNGTQRGGESWPGAGWNFVRCPSAIP